MQSDYFGAAAEPENGRVRSRPDSPTPSGPARKVQKRNSIASNGSNEDRKIGDDDNAAADASTDGAGGPVPSGPPFICPTCSTSYSRLEYLRRHERRRELLASSNIVVAGRSLLRCELPADDPSWWRLLDALDNVTDSFAMLLLPRPNRCRYPSFRLRLRKRFLPKVGILLT